MKDEIDSLMKKHVGNRKGGATINMREIAEEAFALGQESASKIVMSKLKTLKDLNIYDFPDWKVKVRDLRAEAVKWAKYIEVL